MVIIRDELQNYSFVLYGSWPGGNNIDVSTMLMVDMYFLFIFLSLSLSHLKVDVVARSKFQDLISRWESVDVWCSLGFSIF